MERGASPHAGRGGRGARSTDPAEIVEDGGGDFRYVTLAVFRGDGRRRAEYALPAAAPVKVAA